MLGNRTTYIPGGQAGYTSVFDADRGSQGSLTSNTPNNGPTAGTAKPNHARPTAGTMPIGTGPAIAGPRT